MKTYGYFTMVSSLVQFAPACCTNVAGPVSAGQEWGLEVFPSQARDQKVGL